AERARSGSQPSRADPARHQRRRPATPFRQRERRIAGAGGDGIVAHRSVEGGNLARPCGSSRGLLTDRPFAGGRPWGRIDWRLRGSSLHDARSTGRRSIRVAVPVEIDPAAVRLLPGHHVQVRIIGGVAGKAVTDLEIDDVLVRAIYQMMAVLSSRRETGDHTWAEDLLASVGNQHGLAFENVYEFVLPAVPVPQGGHGARPERGEVHAEIPEAEYVAELAL